MKNVRLGLLGILGIWLTMSMMPLVELLQLTAMQATFLRGISGVVVIGLLAPVRRGLVTKPDIHTIRIVGYFILATICLFQAITAWGTNYTALFLDLAVLVPLWFAWRRRQILGLRTWIALVGAILGTVLTLRIYQEGIFVWDGLLWSLGALVANGLFIENAGRAKQKNWNKVFWMSLGLVLVGLPGLMGGISFGNYDLGLGIWLMLVLWFAIATGVLNFYCAFTAFSNLSAVVVGVMILGVTPTIIISSYFMLDKSLDFDQLIGVMLTLGAVLVFGNVLQGKKEN